MVIGVTAPAGRVAGVDTGIAAMIDPLSGGNDPTMTAVNGAYTAAWNSYLADELKFTSTSSHASSLLSFLGLRFGSSQN